VQEQGPKRRFFLQGSNLLAVLAVLVFLAGIVWVTRAAVQFSVKPEDRELQQESNQVMGKLEALLSCALSVRPTGDVVIENGRTVTNRVVLLADLDSDPGAGAWSLDGVRGLERAELLRTSVGGKRLVVRWFPGPDALVTNVVLTDHLNVSNASAFLLGHKSSGGASTITVTVELKKGDALIRSTRTINIKQGAWKPGGS